MKRPLGIGLVPLLIASVSFTGPERCFSQTNKAAEQKAEEQQDADDNDEPVFEIGPGITPPRVIHQVSPAHPDSKGFRISGTVLIELVVSSHGEPKRIRVIKSLDLQIDQSAIDAVREWRFEAAKKDGKPVAVRVTVELRFHDM